MNFVMENWYLILACIAIISAGQIIGRKDKKKKEEEEKALKKELEEKEPLVKEAQGKLKTILKKGMPYPVGKSGRTPMFGAPVEELEGEYAEIARSFAIRNQDWPADYMKKHQEILSLIRDLPNDKIREMISNIDGMPHPKSKES